MGDYQNIALLNIGKGSISFRVLRDSTLESSNTVDTFAKFICLIDKSSYNKQTCGIVNRPVALCKQGCVNN
jgi:hypothetical protein